MAGPSPAKLGAVRTLIETSPDDALRALAGALASAYAGPMAAIREMVETELRDRIFCADVFAPIAPLCGPAAEAVGVRGFGSSVLRKLWARLKADEPGLMAAALDARQDWDREREPEILPYNALNAAAAALLRREPELVGCPREAAEALAARLDLAPLARHVLRRLPEWLGKATDERVIALKVLFKDATAISVDATPRLLEMVLAHLPEPWLILRLIAILTDRASDRYLASSELAAFGQNLLDDVDRRVARVRGFDAQSGVAGAMIVAADVTAACAALAELEQSIELSRDGPWGSRLVAARKSLAANVESRLRDVENTVAQALPLQNVKISGRMTRPAPKLAGDPDVKLVERARGLLVLLEQCRTTAAVGGYGALRNQVAEKVAERLNVYADEVLHLLNTGEAPDEARALAYLEIAAEFLGYAEDQKAAQIVRRRAAVAGERSQDVA